MRIPRQAQVSVAACRLFSVKRDSDLVMEGSWTIADTWRATATLQVEIITARSNDFGSPERTFGILKVRRPIGRHGRDRLAA